MKQKFLSEFRLLHAFAPISRYLRAAGKTAKDIAAAAKGCVWKVAVASAMKSATTAPHPWMARQLNRGSPFRVSRLAAACRRDPGSYEPVR